MISPVVPSAGTESPHTLERIMPRRVLSAFILIATTLAPLIAAPEPPPAAGWPQFLGPNRNGVSAETGLLKTWPKDGPPVAWEREVGAGYSGPVVSGEWLILFHQKGDEEIVEGLEAATGKPAWKYHYETHYKDMFGKGEGPRSTPLIAGDRVFTLGA